MATKRPSNVRQKPGGGWEARAWIDGTRRSFFARTQAEALARMQAAQVDAARGMARPREELTVGEHLDEWLESTVKPGLRHSTYVGYRGIADRYIIPNLGRRRLVDLTPGHVTRMLAKLLADELSDTTVSHVRAVLSSALRVAQQDYGLPRNAAALAKLPRSGRPPFQPEVIPPAQARAMIESFQGSRLAPLVAFSAATGLRQGELLGLRWRDLAVEERALEVHHALDVREGGKKVLARTKTKKSQRSLSLPALAIVALELQREISAADRERAGEAWQDLDFVFPGPTGGGRNGSAVRRNFQAHLRRRGFTPIRWHALRRIFAAVLQEEGATLAQVRDLLGHSTIAVTEHYAYTMPAGLRDAMGRLDDAFGGVSIAGGGMAGDESPPANALSA